MRKNILKFTVLHICKVLDAHHQMGNGQVPCSHCGNISTLLYWHFPHYEDIVTDPSKFQFVGSIPESMYACVPGASRIIKTYKEFLPSGPKELTPEMIQ